MVIPLSFHLQFHDLIPIAQQDFSVSSPDVDCPHVGPNQVDIFNLPEFPMIPRHRFVDDNDKVSNGKIRL